MQAATIKLFLTDGQPAGIRTAEMSNWTGKAIAGPRSELGQFPRYYQDTHLYLTNFQSILSRHPSLFDQLSILSRHPSLFDQLSIVI